MLVPSPAREARDRYRCMKDVRPVAVHKDAVIIVVVEDVADDVGRRSISSTRCPEPTARRSASTLPAKPAPTIRQSKPARRIRDGPAGAMLAGRDGAMRAAVGSSAAGALVSACTGLTPRTASAPASGRKSNPGHLAERAVHPGEPLSGPRCLAQRRLALDHEILRRAGDPSQTGLAVAADHVGDRGRDDRAPGGQVLRRLGGADEAGRIVARERQQRDVPAREVERAAPRTAWARADGCCRVSATRPGRSSPRTEHDRAASAAASRPPKSISSRSRRSSITP